MDLIKCGRCAPRARCENRAHSESSPLPPPHHYLNFPTFHYCFGKNRLFGGWKPNQLCWGNTFSNIGNRLERLLFF